MASPKSPQAHGAELCQMALDANTAALAAFDAIEAGDLVHTIIQVDAALRHLLAINANVKPLAAVGLANLERGLGIKFGPR